MLRLLTEWFRCFHMLTFFTFPHLINFWFGHLVYVFVRKDNDAKLPSDGLQLNASKLESDLDSMIFWHSGCRQHIYICSNC